MSDLLIINVTTELKCAARPVLNNILAKALLAVLCIIKGHIKYNPANPVTIQANRFICKRILTETMFNPQIIPIAIRLIADHDAYNKLKARKFPFTCITDIVYC